MNKNFKYHYASCFNGLLRQYFSKKHDFDSITEQQLKEVEEKLNNRLRKRLGFISPKTVFLSKIKNVAFLIEFAQNSI